MKKKRHYTRVPYDKELTVLLENGRLLFGRAGNFSSGGFLLKIRGENSQQISGMMGKLEVDLQDGSLELECRVTFVTVEGVGFCFVD